jgi:hypothetical protein
MLSLFQLVGRELNIEFVDYEWIKLKLHTNVLSLL